MYTVWEYHPQSFLDGTETLGQPLLGSAGNDRFTAMDLADDMHLVGYNFGERGLTAPDKTLELASTSEWEVVTALMAIDEPASLESRYPTTNVNLIGFQNPRNPLDVSDDGFISPIDALMVINLLNARLPAQSQNAVGLAPAVLSAPYYDTDGDGQVSPIDALLVINFLNSKRSTGKAEGESSVQPECTSSPSHTDPADATCLDFLVDLLAEDVIAARRKKT